MTNQKSAERELTALALDLVKGSRKSVVLDSEASVLRLKESLDSKIISKAAANKEIRRKSQDMAARHFVS